MFLVVVACLSVVLTFLWIRSRRPANYPPGPTPLPLLGNLGLLIGGSNNILEVFRQLRGKYGDVICLSLGPNWVIIVNGRDNLRELFVKRGDVTSDRPVSFVINLLKQRGIVSSSGATWKHNRTFAVTKLRDFGFGKRSFEASIMEEVNKFLEFVNDINGKPFKLTEILNTSVANALMSIVSGERLEYNDKKIQYLVEIVTSLATNERLTGIVNFFPWLAKLPFDPFGVQQVIKPFDQLFVYWHGVIQDHKKTLDGNKLDNFIDIYLHEMAHNGNTDKFEEDQLLSILVDMFIAGTETTSTAIKWFVMYMLHHPEVQDKMEAEIGKVVGHGRLPSLSDKPSLPYCEAVMYETLRLSNIGPLALPHLVTADIDHNGYVIPKGSLIIPCLDSVAFDEKTYPDSYAFKPERFLDDEGKLNITNNNNIMTFSLGRRVCMGEALAKMELFLYITSLVQRFTFCPPENEAVPSKEPVFASVLQPKPFRVRAVTRT